MSEKKTNTAERLRQIMRKRGLRQVDVLELVKPYCERFGVRLEKNDLSQYCSGKVEPKQDKLTILGQALGVSEAWLMGFDVPMERTVPPAIGQDDGRVNEMLGLFSRMNDAQKNLIISVAKEILSEK